ncbi:YcjX family protein [Vibrio salinus]|uniref:YcjX family protein n=1 Tax=Vibrio salinus TaxID=2899784 RepID=UPI001E41F677|nr:YcjX family protein [Vibrio salinus]MCE0492452.1 YcjX family protein [Vibrio salinus]
MGRLSQEISDIVHRGLDSHIKIAVTGLSRAGKTAFITSFVNQLLYSSTHNNLPFLHASRDSRLIGAKRIPQSNLLVPGFAYEQALSMLHSTPAGWPEPTRDVSEIRLAIKYKPESRTKKLISKTHTLYVDIVDYPGEWLLDLPLLKLSYDEWSEKQMNSMHGIRKKLAYEWLERVNLFEVGNEANEKEISEISYLYTQFLIRCKKEGLHWVQPGRFVLPGELKGAPVLQFFPLPDSKRKGDKHSAYEMLASRYEEYRTQIVKRFYKHYFSTFDRQIVLVDCLSPLNAGYESFMDMRSALEELIHSYHYGKNNLFGRLFSPKIDKVLFAATKADHITPDQHGNLLNLLNQMINPVWQSVAYENISMKCLSTASIRATTSGHVTMNGKSHSAIRGLDNAGNDLTIYPGEVPKKLPDVNFWSHSKFDFTAFNPNVYEHDAPLPHIRVDTAMEFLLGDKLR